MEDTRGTITLLGHEDNVLTREALLLLLDLHRRVEAVQYEGKSYADACMKVPVTNIGLASTSKRRRRKRRQADASGQSSSSNQPTAFNLQYDYIDFYDDETDITDAAEEGEERLENLPKDIYCDIVETLEEKCGEYSILEIWKYDPDVISGLTQRDIVDAINTVEESPVFGLRTDYADYLGQVERNGTGHVVGARTVRTIWLEQFDPGEIPPSRELVGFEMDQGRT